METLPALEPPPVVEEIIASTPDARVALVRPLATPIVDGDRSTFLHLGPADTATVEHFMARFPAFPQMRRIARGVHEVTVRLPTGARVEYKLGVGIEGAHRRFLDPFNPRRATDPFGANSVAFGPGYQEPWWTAEPAGSTGTLHRGFVQSEAFGQRRFVHWYHPAAARRSLPLVVVHDGKDFIRHAGVVRVFDNLIAARHTPPFVAALIDPADRLGEYTDDRRHGIFVREVAAAAARRHGADPDPASHVYVGASLGGVAALSAAWRGGPIGGLVVMSGSFVTALGGPNQRGPQFQPVIDFLAEFAAEATPVAARTHQSCGVYEGLAPDNRAFRSVLAATGTNLVYEEAPDGHHWHNWRDRLGVALTHVLPGGDTPAPGSVEP